MAKLLFLELEQETHWAVASVGPAYIAAYVRLHNHSVSLVNVKVDADYSRILSEIQTHSPDIIGISLTSRQWLSAKNLVHYIKQTLNIPVIAGGLFATFSSDVILETSGFDFVCLGEGELATCELLDTIDAGSQHFNNIRNIRSKGQPIPELRPVFSPIDDMPFIARDMLGEQYGVVNISTQRGCPYPCTYCAAHHINNLYENGYAEYGRRRSVANVIDELLQIKQQSELNYVVFLDDTFTLNHRWLDSFCRVYGLQLHTPFSINARVETVNETVLKHLADAGCRHVIYGVESGSERVRQDILKRNVSNIKMVKAFEWTRENGMLATANYMLGIPGETEDDIQQTLDLHEQLKPDDFGYFIFYPYPGTSLFKLCKDKGYLPENYHELPANHHQSILNLPDLSQEVIAHYFEKFTNLRIRDRMLAVDDVKEVTDQMNTAAAQI